MPTFYVIQINEAQRIALLKLLAANAGALEQPDPENIDESDPSYHPLYYWHGMLIDLAKVDQIGADGKHILNGFSL